MLLKSSSVPALLYKQLMSLPKAPSRKKKNLNVNLIKLKY